MLRNNADAGKVVEAYMDGVLTELQRLAALPDSELAARVKALDADVQSK